MKKIISAGIIILTFPYVALAATPVTNLSLINVINNIVPAFTSLVPIMTSLALLGFFWGVAMFIWNGGNDKKRAEGRYVMIWGIIALFVFLSITGIISLLQSTLSVGGNSVLTPPSANPANYTGN